MRNKVANVKVTEVSVTEARMAKLRAGNYIGSDSGFNMKTQKQYEGGVVDENGIVRNGLHEKMLTELLNSIQAGRKINGNFKIAVATEKLGSKVVQDLIAAGVHVYAQVSHIPHASGDSTGAVLTKNIKASGAKGVLVDHSEARKYYEDLLAGQPAEVIQEKVNAIMGQLMAAALDAGLEVDYCFGETAEQRDNGEAAKVVEAQVAVLEAVLTPERMNKLVDAGKTGNPLLRVSYEPRWAIGGGKETPTAESNLKTAMNIREQLIDIGGTAVARTIPLRYGGSANDKNMGDYNNEFTHGVLAATYAFGMTDVEVGYGATVKDFNILTLMEKLQADKAGVAYEPATMFNVQNLVGTSASKARLLELRPPNIQTLFPNSKANIVSGKVIDRAMIAQGNAMTIAANGRNKWIIEGVMRAAQRANAAIMFEIAKSEGGQKAYCAPNFWTLALYADSIANRIGATIPFAIHADHYGVAKAADVDQARIEIPSMFEAGATSIALDASKMTELENLLANITLAQYIPGWAGFETEIGEIQGKEGLSKPEEAEYQIKALNSKGIHPDWIAVNNGSVHGQTDDELGIRVPLTSDIHNAIAEYKVSGAQHGTSGNNSDRLREIASKTNTTKANVATALQMVSWGVEVDDYGNAIKDSNGEFVKVKGEGVAEATWEAMKKMAADNNWKGGNYKNLNRPFENIFAAQEPAIQRRMVARVEAFAYNLMVNVFNIGGTADIAKSLILSANSYDLGPKVGIIESASYWTDEKIAEVGHALEEERVRAAGDHSE